MRKLVTVDKIAEAFRMSERAVQRLVIYDGMPRTNRGKYDLESCLAWYANFLHAKVCGCAGPCEGFDPDTRNLTNARAERKSALKEIADGIADQLVGKKANVIRSILSSAIEKTYDG